MSTNSNIADTATGLWRNSLNLAVYCLSAKIIHNEKKHNKLVKAGESGIENPSNRTNMLRCFSEISIRLNVLMTHLPTF